MSKSWEQPWSTDEIIQNSDTWSLAGDVALLNTLKAFADSILSRTGEINTKLQSLTNNLEETSLQLDIAQNEFQGLRNTQFIESRVYEDDECLPVNEEKKVEEKKEDHTEEVRLAALKGLEVLEEYFDKVEVSVSDSEDEDIDLPNYVLRPKDLYIDRPLPYVIGSDEWHKTWHVGLEDSSSDSETEKVSDKFSESDSESELPIIQDRSQIKGTSDTSSEFDFSQKTEAKLNIPNSSDSDNSVPAHGPISSINFAEQLAAKLGHVITEYQEPEVNTRPIIQSTSKSHYGDMFFDEPPPLDEPKGLFSGGGALFDDDETASPKIPKSGGLFDEGDSDDDMFAKKSSPISKKPSLPEETPIIDKKKPVGGVSILGGGNLFDKKLLRRQPSSEDEESEESEKKTIGETHKTKVDLFGEDDLFSGGSQQPKIGETLKKEKVNLFDSDKEEEDANSLFEEEKKSQKSVENVYKEEAKTGEIKSKKISLFDDDDDLFKDDLFSTNSKKSFTSGLFDDIVGEDLFEEKSKSQTGNLFDDLLAIPDKDSINVDTSSRETKPFFTSSPPEDLFESATSSKSEPVPKPRLSLFDSPPPDPDDLFGSKNSPTSDLFDETPPKTDLIPCSTPQNRSSLQLFDPNPPPDDLWDSKSDVSDSEDFANDFEESTHKTSLFSEEPPSLDLKPEGAKPKPGKLRHNLNINVGALMPGYVPPKRTEKASTDVVDKSSTNVTKNDDPISSSEISTLSKPNATTSSVDITKPSFNQSDSVEVLHSVTKDRARVPLNRRPSTRKGRKAALRTSSSDFKLSQENEPNSEETEEKRERRLSLGEDESLNQKGSSSLFVRQKSDDLFVSSEKSRKVEPTGNLFESPGLSEKRDDDLFATSVDLPKAGDLFGSSKISENLSGDEDLFATSENVPKTSSLFESPKLSSDDLFTTSKNTDKNLADSDDLFRPHQSKKDNLFVTPVKTTREESVKKETKIESKSSSLFDDEDDDDDLFSAKKPIQSAKPKKSLFDDNEDEDDDIFKSFSNAGVKKTESKLATEKKIPKVSSIKKLENTKPDDDPLSALLK